ncbi:type II toxin-antitoxin system VapC family toxin [Leptothrix discophora]|uniref:Type II toxin-antitoxin system VapC family toxin n=1 Tax=Leptothrix discophora TaxID=89 RepID=A0ABT9G8G4_LEPDI|nr:type II toxin-antitoxin system VapC family toxin [Leptothrix discophora]MDP4302755.1 type II toxin-antitoxin system VapC family toxin [Leptothrix discophora]
MIGLDTNVLARYYIEDSGDTEATRQREQARRLIESGQALMVSRSVVLELEWVMRGYYGFDAPQCLSVLRHLLTMRHVTLEDRPVVEQAIANAEAGLDFADALHHAAYRECRQVASFDDRKFARRAKKLALAPPVVIPA